MANNPYVNKVVYGNQTVIDLSSDTAVASDVAQGKTFHDATGALLTGTYTPSASGYTIHIFTEDSNLFGNTITITKDDVVLGTTTFDNTGNATFDVQQKGTYVASTTYQGTVYQKAVNVTDEFLVELSETLDGKTVLPTDDIQIWLKCAGINDKTYTTLAEVLADTDTLSALIASENAVDYMVRSTTWAVAQALVPIMTSDTTPSGEAFANPENNTYLAFKCFAQDNSLLSKVTNNVGSYIGYDFNHPVSISKTLFRGGYSLGSTFKIQGYKNNEWVDITSFVSEAPNQDPRPSNYQTISSPCDNIEKVRLYQNTKVSSVSNNCDYWELQFYSTSITDNETAMSYIGLNNYCANTLLSDITWKTAIYQSEYKGSVLNVQIPQMTSNTTPSGTCGGTSVSGSGNDYWKAFNSSEAFGWQPSGSDTYGVAKVYYHFTSKNLPCYARLKWIRSGATYSMTVKVIGSNDGATWTEISPAIVLYNNVDTDQILNAIIGYEYVGMVVTYSEISITAGDGFKCQFYGREDVVEPQPVTERVLYDRGTENTSFTMGASPAFKNAAVKQQDAIQMNYSSSSSYGFKTTDAIDVSDYDTLKVYIAVNGDEQTENYQFVATADLSRYSTVQLLIGYIGNTVQIQASETVGGTRYVIGADGSRYNLAVKVYKIWLEKSCVNC